VLGDYTGPQMPPTEMQGQKRATGPPLEKYDFDFSSDPNAVQADEALIASQPSAAMHHSHAGGFGGYGGGPPLDHMLAMAIDQILAFLLSEAGQDYTKFKLLIDAYWARLPSHMRVTFYYRAHGIGTSTFSWSLLSKPNAEAIMRLLLTEATACTRMISMGAGTGYTEGLLKRAAHDLGRPIEVMAYDTWLSSFEFNARQEYGVTVQTGNVDQLYALATPNLHDAVLLLCWPPFGSVQEELSTMGYECLQLFRSLGGEFVVYIGDICSTGDWRMHQVLYNEWTLYEATREFEALDVWVPEKMGCWAAGNDSVGVYRIEETQRRNKDQTPATLLGLDR
jgi:hypothetical protein